MGAFVDDDGLRLEPEDYPELYFPSDTFQEIGVSESMDAAMEAAENGDFFMLNDIFGMAV